MTDMVSVRFDELDSVGEVVSLTTSQAESLIATELVEARPEGDGQWRLLPRGRVGAVRIDDLQVEVVPKEKVGLTHLLFLLGYAKDPGFRPEDVFGTQDDELFPALSYSLAQAVDRALSHGVVQGYRTTDEALRTIRGRIRFGDQIRSRPGMLIPIEVTYDDFSVDTAENRILRAALRTMLAVPRLDSKVRRRLAHLEARLDGVSTLQPWAAIPTWRPSRLNERYQPALRLSEIVLRHASAKPGDPGVEVASFVAVMWKVFEDFVTVALTEALARLPGQTRAQLKGYLAGPGDWRNGLIEMSIDVAYLDSAKRPLVVFDAKYKLASVEGRYANADHYQMLGYCTSLEVKRAWLIYAGGSRTAQVRRLKNTSIDVVVCPLDLSQHPRQILKQVERIARLAVQDDRKAEHPVIRMA